MLTCVSDRAAPPSGPVVLHPDFTRCWWVVVELWSCESVTSHT